MAIPKHIIERIYDTAKIEEVVSDYVTLRRKGANLWGCCPFHDEKTPSFSVSPSKGIFKCFGCGKAGNSVGFIMEYEQCSYVEAIRMLSAKYHIEFEERELTEEERAQQTERDSLFAVNEWSKKWFRNQLWETEEGKTIGLSYFRERGIREETIKTFQLGYSPAKNALYAAAKKAGYQDEYLLKTGLCGKSEQSKNYYDRFKDRVIFPIINLSGRAVAFAGRILVKKENTGKYVNSPESEIYSKQAELYGLFQAKKSIVRLDSCYLVEGQMDVISMFQAGVENVVSSGGTSLTAKQVRLLHRFTNNVVVLYDGDGAGIHAALRGIDMLIEEGINVKVILLPEGEDPDSMARTMSATDFKQYLNDNIQDFIRFKTGLLLKNAANDISKISQAHRDIIKSIALVPDVITRNLYIKEGVKLLGISEELIRKEVGNIRRDTYFNQKDNQTKTGQEHGDNGIDNIDKKIDKEIVDNNRTDNAISKPISRYQHIFKQNMLNLIKILIKYGKYPFFDSTVGDYIIEFLEADQIPIDEPIFYIIFNDYKNHSKEQDFIPENFFKFHPNKYVCALAIDLISEKYSLSKIFSKQNISENVTTDKGMPTDADRLTSLVKQLVYELELTTLKKEMEELQYKIKEVLERKEDAMPYLKKQMEMKQIEQQLCKELGNRTFS